MKNQTSTSASATTTRRDFLKTSMLAGLGLGSTGLLRLNAAQTAPLAKSTALRSAPATDIGTTRPRPAGQKPVFDLTTKPLDKVRVGLIGLGQRGDKLSNDLLKLDFVELTAICDIRPERAALILKKAQDMRNLTPATYSGDEHAWEKLAERDDIDVVYVATPWEWHVPMCVKAMNTGKHAFVEVAAALTVDDCWELVDTSERTQRHCVILENCCYGEDELFALNLTREGVLGTLTHGECAYIHDLRYMLYKLGTEGDWRREYHKKLNGNLYPTHGLGPVCQCMGVGRGDAMKFLVSVSSREASLSKYLREKNPNKGRHKDETYVCGDINTSLVKTEKGRTIMIQHDVVNPRPYSRINALNGTAGMFAGFPGRLSLDNRARHGLSGKGEEWLGAADMKIMRDKFTHPLFRELRDRAKTSGHGGMDIVMSYRLLDCIRRGITPDITVYEAAAWSSIIELSCKSVETGSQPIPVPDFTRGAWKARKPLGIVTA